MGECGTFGIKNHCNPRYGKVREIGNKTRQAHGTWESSGELGNKNRWKPKTWGNKLAPAPAPWGGVGEIGNEKVRG